MAHSFAWTSHRRLRMQVAEEKMEDFFERFDRNKDGELSRQELTEAFESLDARYPSWRAKRALSFADADRNGSINLLHEMDRLVKYAVNHGYHRK